MPSNQDAVGIVGLGLVGTAISTRLMAANRPVVGTDVDESARRRLADAGGDPVASADELFSRCSTALLCLPTSRIVADVLKGASDTLRPGRLLIDMTTGDPEDVGPLAESLGARNISYVEAKIAGSSEQLKRGEAIILLAGDPQLIVKAQPLIDALTGRSFNLGSVGAASRFKLVHNLILGLNRAVLAEGLKFAEALGFDSSDVLTILSHTPAESQVMKTKGRKMVAADFSPQATLSQHLKDVRLILEAAQRGGAYTPLSKIHRELLEFAERSGYGSADNSAVITAFDRTQQNQD